MIGDRIYLPVYRWGVALGPAPEKPLVVLEARCSSDEAAGKTLRGEALALLSQVETEEQRAILKQWLAAMEQGKRPYFWTAEGADLARWWPNPAEEEKR